MQWLSLAENRNTAVSISCEKLCGMKKYVMKALSAAIFKAWLSTLKKKAMKTSVASVYGLCGCATISALAGISGAKKRKRTEEISAFLCISILKNIRRNIIENGWRRYRRHRRKLWRSTLAKRRRHQLKNLKTAHLLAARKRESAALRLPKTGGLFISYEETVGGASRESYRSGYCRCIMKKLYLEEIPPYHSSAKKKKAKRTAPSR